MLHVGAILSKLRGFIWTPNTQNFKETMIIVQMLAENKTQANNNRLVNM